MKQVEVGEEAIEKMEKAKKLIAEERGKEIPSRKDAEKKKKVKAHIRGANYKKAKKEVEKTSNHQLLTLEEAIKLLKKIKYTKFDESVELHINTHKENIKGEVELPHSTGKKIRVKIVDSKVLEEIEKGKLDFDILITHPQYMPMLAKHAKVLGPKGLMPNPKAGTISDKPEEIAKKFLKGSLRWKTEAKAPLIHQMIGKISFEDKTLAENASALLVSIGKSQIQSAFIKTTMSPSIKIQID